MRNFERGSITPIGDGLVLVTGVGGAQRFMMESDVAGATPEKLEELTVLIEAAGHFYFEDMGWPSEPTPLEQAAVLAQRLVWADEKRRKAAAAKARDAAGAPRARRQHPARERAMQIAGEIADRRPGISAARLADRVADALMTDGLDPPAPRSIRRWITNSGL